MVGVSRSTRTTVARQRAFASARISAGVRFDAGRDAITRVSTG